MPSKILLTFLFLSIILNSPASTTSQECPYPCYPPPTGPGNLPPATPTPPSSQTGWSNPPPAFNPPPQGFLPNYPPPPYFVNGAVPPPPDPIVPWFPYYYKKPPHGTDQSSSTALPGWTAVIASTPLLVFVHLLLIFQ